MYIVFETLKGLPVGQILKATLRLAEGSIWRQGQHLDTQS